ncbi:hypothetical protein DW846_01915 [Ruminococcus sp. AM36-2AA]|nr:hypothetical protein DW851_01910 [Ruminococcus sp. AM36-5]RGH62381.1 hypothetical protein DW846_01915 [Ruminococcus sp. AM36-2AA]
MSEWIRNYTIDGNRPPLYEIVEIIMTDGTIREDMMIKGKYGNCIWRNYTDAYVAGWRYIEEKSNKKENKDMMNNRKNNKENRVAALKAAGMNTGKYFSISLPEGLQPGAKINITIDENGVPVFDGDGNNIKTNSALTPDEKVLLNQVCVDGYVKNSKLHRRWVMAQMFRMLNYESYDGKRFGYDAYLNDNYGYMYQFDMILEEIRVLGKLQERDMGEFNKRKRFFNDQVVVDLIKDYKTKLKKYIEKLPIRKCKGTPYKRICGKNIFVEDIYQKVLIPFDNVAYNVVYNMTPDTNYMKLYLVLKRLVKFAKQYKLPFETPKCKEWKNAYKGAGSYYTLMNMVKFHNCRANGMYGLDGVYFIEMLTDQYGETGEYYKLFAFLKKTIEDNHFDFGLRMKEIYGK